MRDDKEHGMGHRLLKQIIDRGTTNIVLICVRWAGTIKLGPLRFDSAMEAAKDVLNSI